MPIACSPRRKASSSATGWENLWPADWLRWTIFGQEVPLPHVALAAAALLITLAACRCQMLAFLLAGLAGLAFSIHVLGHLYFNELPT